MTTDRSARAEVVDLDMVRMARRVNSIKSQSSLLHDPMPTKNEGVTSKLAHSITLHEAVRIAQSIVEKYGRGGALLTAFLERRKNENAYVNEELHEVLGRQKRMTAAYSTDQLKALLAHYAHSPLHFHETYALPAAEEFLSRFQPYAEEA